MLIQLLLILSVAQGLAATMEQRPNVLLLMPDQWRYDWDGLHDDEGSAIPLKLPNLRALQNTGTRFTQAYVPAVVCAPSRSCMASLREYDRAGTATNGANDFDVSIPTYFTALQNAGYHTMSTGKDDLTKKTQLGYKLGHDTRNTSNTYHQKELGFSDAIRYSGKEDVVNTYPTPHEGYGYFLNSSTVHLESGKAVNGYDAHYACIKGGGKLCDSSSYPQRLYEDDWTAQNAVQLIQRAPNDKPWFLWASFPGPHNPFAVTASMAASVSNRTWPRAVDSNMTRVCQAPQGEPGVGVLRCNYGAEIENLDRLFGVVIGAVRKQGSLDNTVICAFSDHGEMLDDHNDEAKSKPWQGAVAVPLVCAGPGIQRRTIETPMATVDIGATVLDLAGAVQAPGMTARSFRGLLEGSSLGSRNRTYVYSGLQSSDFGVQPQKQDFDFRLVVAQMEGWASSYKYVCCAGACPGSPSTVSAVDDDGYTRLLYDTVADPFDMRDLKHQHPEIAEQLRKQLPVENLFNCSKPNYA